MFSLIPVFTTILEWLPCRPYNELKAWEYCKLAEAMDAGAGSLLAFKVGWRP